MPHSGRLGVHTLIHWIRECVTYRLENASYGLGLARKQNSGTMKEDRGRDMKLTMQRTDQGEDEVIIRYREQDKRIRAIAEIGRAHV